MKFVGKVLWWDKKDQNGIIIDVNSNEYYFDISVVEGRESSIKAGAVVQFQINKKIADNFCAKAVILPTTKSRNKLEREFEKNLQLSFAI